MSIRQIVVPIRVIPEICSRGVLLCATQCPAPWRVPTKDDFINLDKAMGGTGDNRYGAFSQLPKYLGTGSNQWGGGYGGYVGSGSMIDQGSDVRYWSQTEGSSGYVSSLRLYSSGYIYPQNDDYKGYGFALRCVK